MMRSLLVRGMLAGLAAGVLAFVFAHIFGEPQVDHAIGFEEARAAAAHEPPEPELVSRGTQSSIGLLTGVAVYSVAIGGIFALVFAACYGRVVQWSPRVSAAALAFVAWLVVFVVPFTKYPSNPPSIGNPDTIGKRTALYVVMLAISIAAAIAAYRIGRSLVARFGGWNAGLLGLASFVALIVLAQLVLPGIHETPRGFSADVLYRFRLSSLGIQAVLYTTLGLGFGWAAERVLTPRSAAARTVTAPARG